LRASVQIPTAITARPASQKQQLKVKSRYLRQTVPHVAFSLNSPILGLAAGGYGFLCQTGVRKFPRRLR